MTLHLRRRRAEFCGFELLRRLEGELGMEPRVYTSPVGGEEEGVGRGGRRRRVSEEEVAAAERMSMSREREERRERSAEGEEVDGGAGWLSGPGVDGAPSP